MLQHAAYTVEADLIGFDGIPPLQESLEELMSAPLTWIGIRDEGGGLAGALGYTSEDQVVDIDRLVVAPERFRSGCGSALIGALDPGSTVTVSTGSANTPAHSFYSSLGFTKAREEQVVPGLKIAHFTREPQP